jgi:hypothetical protein
VCAQGDVYFRQGNATSALHITKKAALHITEKAALPGLHITEKAALHIKV